MKKRILMFVAVITFALTMTACGAEKDKVENNKIQTEINEQAGVTDNVEISDDNEPEATTAPTGEPEATAKPVNGSRLSTLIFIDGKEYDLSEDIQEVVSTMIKDGIKVLYSGIDDVCDENGESINYSFLEASIEAKKHYVGIHLFEEMYEESKEGGNFFFREYYTHNMQDQNVVSGFGISSATDVEHELDKSFFVMTGKYNSEQKRYTGVFVDGNAMNISVCRDELEALKQEETIQEMLMKYFPHWRVFSQHGTFSVLIDRCRNYEDLREKAEKAGTLLDEELLLQLMLEKAFEQVKNGEIDGFVVVSFLVDGEERLYMHYSEYYFE